MGALLERGTESLRIRTHDVILFFEPDLPSLSHLSTADTATFKTNHGLFVYMLYGWFTFKFKISAMYSKPGNN